MRNILVIAAHPDDEILGAGGAILRHIDKGDKVFWLIVTNIFESQGFSKVRIAKRQEEIEQVAKEVGISKVYKLDIPTMSLSDEMLGELVQKISKVFHEVCPETIYTLNRSDAHSDHRILSDAVMACTKAFRYPFIKQVLMYECLSETEFAPAFPEKTFIPNYFIDISDHLDKKLSLLSIYESEMGEHPFPRSIENVKALATLRGATAGVRYAEAFQLVKYIDK